MSGPVVATVAEADRSPGDGLDLPLSYTAPFSPAAIIAVSPLWMLASLTIAIGFSLPPFLVAKVWGQAPSALS